MSLNAEGFFNDYFMLEQRIKVLNYKISTLPPNTASKKSLELLLEGCKSKHKLMTSVKQKISTGNLHPYSDFDSTESSELSESFTPWINYIRIGYIPGLETDSSFYEDETSEPY